MENLLIVNIVLLWVFVVFNIILTLAIIRRVNDTAIDPTPEMLQAGAKIPDFMAKSLSGDVFTLSSYTGDALLFIFISYGCPYCTEKLSVIDRLYYSAKQRNVDVITVSLSADVLTREYVAEHNFTAPVLVAFREDTAMVKDFGVINTPSYYYVNKERRVISRGLLGAQWEKVVQPLLAVSQ